MFAWSRPVVVTVRLPGGTRAGIAIEPWQRLPVCGWQKWHVWKCLVFKTGWMSHKKLAFKPSWLSMLLIYWVVCGLIDLDWFGMIWVSCMSLSHALRDDDCQREVVPSLLVWYASRWHEPGTGHMPERKHFRLPMAVPCGNPLVSESPMWIFVDLWWSLWIFVGLCGSSGIFFSLLQSPSQKRPSTFVPSVLRESRQWKLAHAISKVRPLQAKESGLQ